MADLRPALPGEDAALARLIYLAGAGMYDIYAGGSDRSLDLIRTAIASPGVSTSRETLTVAELDGEPAGVLCAFPAGQARARNRRMLLLALRRLPPWRWLPILRVELLAGRSFPEPPADSLYIDILATGERFRRRGVASALLGAAEARAHELGLRALALDTNERNSAARALYERAGFRVTQRVPATGPIPPELIYVRELS